MKRWSELATYLRLPGEIDPARLGIDLSTAQPIDKSESSVYASGDKVLKIYNGFMSHLIDWIVLCRYQEVTRIVAELIEKDTRFCGSFRVVPIERIGRLKNRSLVCAVSAFIPGENLSGMLSRQSAEETGLMIAVFNRLNSVLQEKTGEPAVRIDFTNAKQNPETGVITITDVCGQIATFNPRFTDEPAIFMG